MSGMRLPQRITDTQPSNDGEGTLRNSSKAPPPWPQIFVRGFWVGERPWEALHQRSSTQEYRCARRAGKKAFDLEDCEKEKK